jgi:hypothetical protein
VIRLLAFLFPVLCQAAELVVYAPETVSSLRLHRILAADPALEGVEVFVTSRWRTFEDQLAAHPTAWALANAPLLLEHGWSPVLQGQRLGVASFRYRVIAIDASPSAGLLSAATMGMLQECGRDRVDRMIADLFPAYQLPGRHRMVGKPADLLQILGLELVGCVLVTPTQATQAMASFPGRVRVLAESRPVRLPLVAVREPGEAPAAARLAGLGSAALTELGLDTLVPFAGDPTPWIEAPGP